MADPATFNLDGARRIVAATRSYEANDPLSTGPKSRRSPRGAGRQEYVTARVTGFDSANLAYVKAKEQYWSEDEGFIDVPNGRTWDGESLDMVWCSTLPSINEVVVLGHRYGPGGVQTWFVVPGGTWTFPAKITSSTSLGTNRWKYAWTEQVRTASAWTDRTDGRSGTTTTNFAINGAEANNDGTGIQGNGIDIDGQTFTDNPDLAMQPIQGNPVVQMIGHVEDGALYFDFVMPNAIDGECA